MPSPTRLLVLAALLVSASAIVAPGHRGTSNTPQNDTTPDSTPDSSVIVQTAQQVDQKSGASTDAPPNADVPPTSVTAVDGDLTNQTVTSVASSRRSLGKRATGYEMVFNSSAGHDASIEGTAYLTYTVVNNATYNVKACTDWCSTVEGCVFVNLYYEFNNYLLDFVFSEKSNLKCAAYGDIHGAQEKTNFGGQASYPQNGNEAVPLTFITQSTGWAVDSLVDPDTPEGYELVFGPTGGANNAQGYMGFAFIDKYDVRACAILCNGRGADPVGGVCQYFNIWRAVVNGVPTTYTCSMYYLPSDASTAVNTGQGNLVVTYSRGYKRTSFLIDGGFEGFTACNDFCFAASYANWIGTSPPNGDLDASFFFFPPFARTGHGSALLGAAFGDDTLSGTITPAQPLTITQGRQFVPQCFFDNSFSGPSGEAAAKVDMFWNGENIGTVTGFQTYAPFQAATVTSTSSDILKFVGGSAPAWTFIDDCGLFMTYTS
ncbi:hypothetical protein B0H10DRAFT_2233717 [Mycena sp. CBHHK59/15]|nr:hypothetical protein B0H10DRAFT_2233717 [Mycena sp. CBHHK59/15]